MTILELTILIFLALIIGQVRRGRGVVILMSSVTVLYWLQPTEAYGNLAFWLPTGTLALVVLGWLLTAEKDVRAWQKNWLAFGLLGASVLLVDLNRYAHFDALFPVLNPRPFWVFGVLAGMAILCMILLRWPDLSRRLLPVMLIGLLGLFLILKFPLLLESLSVFIPALKGTIPERSFTLSWLGYSYLAFRLIHTFRDRQSGRLPSVTLEEYVNYMIFFPAFTAGPIDRIERFLRELRTPIPLTRVGWLEAGTRLFVGLVKKFVFADLLAMIALNDTLATGVSSTGWLWFFLFVYSLRIYFDFSGYTDLALGMARLMGIRLPENFAAPYFKPNLAQFWNAWHITLTQWFRAYFFNPLTRTLRTAHRPLSPALSMLILQVSTMVLIGLWHGVTWNFALWGLWHGVGLFLQNQWSAFIRSHVQPWMQHRFVAPALHGLSIAVTFTFVSLSWLFFSLSTPTLVWQTLLRLSGVR